MLKSMRLRRFVRDQKGGEKDNINTMLILALIVIPLVMLIIYFAKKTGENSNEAVTKALEAAPDFSSN